MKTMKEETKNYLRTMAIKETSKLPTLQLLREQFRKLAVEKHPDKGGSNEAFKELYRGYET